MMNLATTTNSAQYQHMVEGAEMLQQGKKKGEVGQCWLSELPKGRRAQP